ncbi:MAG: hypothetical protein IJF52_06040 [Clostridia bacterium]|nr:hypothetical protein [Clostridia bacterium]
MKKMLVIILMAALLILAGTVGTVAVCANFADENSNGICDNRETGEAVNAEENYVSCGKSERGRNFVDEDQNGVCDNREALGGFTDRNGDGICDNQNADRAKEKGCHGNGDSNFHSRGVCRRGR